MDYILEFERPITELESQIQDLKEASERPNIDISGEIKALEKKVDVLIHDIYKNLTPWERVQLSRHPSRPHTLDHINEMVDDFKEIHGDRSFSDDRSIIAGFGYLDGQKIAVIGIEKGRKTKDKIVHNFGMAKPEGYRKALRVMELATKFSLPIITLVDTPGAYPGIGAEERGQAFAIAHNLQEMFSFEVPIISVIIGEGGSGGALGIAVADKVLMMEYSVYSVISPESCASILWSDPSKAQNAANSLQLGPKKSLELGVIDAIISEPMGGAHRDSAKASRLIKEKVLQELALLKKLKSSELLELRYQKFRLMGNQTITDTSDTSNIGGK